MNKFLESFMGSLLKEDGGFYDRKPFKTDKYRKSKTTEPLELSTDEKERLLKQTKEAQLQDIAKKEAHLARKEALTLKSQKSLSPEDKIKAQYSINLANRIKEKKRLEKVTGSKKRLEDIGWDSKFTLEEDFWVPQYDNIPESFKKDPSELLKDIKAWNDLKLELKENVAFSLNEFKRLLFNIAKKANKSISDSEIDIFIDELINDKKRLIPITPKKYDSEVVREEITIDTASYLACVDTIVEYDSLAYGRGFVSQETLKKLDKDYFTIIPDYLRKSKEDILNIIDVQGARKPGIHEINLNIFKAYYNILTEDIKSLTPEINKFNEPSSGALASRDIGGDNVETAIGVGQSEKPRSVESQLKSAGYAGYKAMLQSQAKRTIMPTAALAMDLYLSYYRDHQKDNSITLVGYDKRPPYIPTEDNILHGKAILKFCMDTLYNKDKNKVILDPNLTHEKVKNNAAMFFRKPQKGVDREYRIVNQPDTYISGGDQAEYMYSIREAVKPTFKINSKVERWIDGKDSGIVKKPLENMNLIASAIVPYNAFEEILAGNEEYLKEEEDFNNIFKQYYDALKNNKSEPKSEHIYKVSDKWIGSKETKKEPATAPIDLKFLGSGTLKFQEFLSYKKGDHYLFSDSSNNLYIYRDINGFGEKEFKTGFQPYSIKVLEWKDYFYRDPATEKHDTAFPIPVTRVLVHKGRSIKYIKDQELEFIKKYNKVFIGTKRDPIQNLYIFKGINENTNNFYLYKLSKHIENIPDFTIGDKIKIKSAHATDESPITNQKHNPLFSGENKIPRIKVKINPKTGKKTPYTYYVLDKQKIEFPKDAKLFEISNISNFGGFKDLAIQNKLSPERVEEIKKEDEDIRQRKEEKKALKYQEKHFPKEKKIEPMTIERLENVYNNTKKLNLLPQLSYYLTDKMDDFYTEEFKGYNDLQNKDSDKDKFYSVDNIIIQYDDKKLESYQKRLKNKLENAPLKRLKIEKEAEVKEIEDFIENHKDNIKLLQKYIKYRMWLDERFTDQTDINNLIKLINYNTKQEDKEPTTESYLNKTFNDTIFKFLKEKSEETLEIKQNKGFDIAIQTFLK